jgi:hypothetical protein
MHARSYCGAGGRCWTPPGIVDYRAFSEWRADIAATR